MSTLHERPVWDRGEPIDAGMLAFTIGDDWLQDRRLVAHDIEGSLAHAAGLARAGLIGPEDHAAIRTGLERLLASFQAGEWTVEEGDEDVHSAVERRLTELVGEPGKCLHTGRSRNEQVALDLRLWLRDALDEAARTVAGLRDALASFAERHGALALPGYTHLRRAMPSTLADWALAHAKALAFDEEELAHARARLAECPLGTGSGYGVPLALERAFVAELLGFERPEEPPTAVQHGRGRAELAYLTALEGVALDVGKLCADLWLYTGEEFGLLRIPAAFTTGSSLMPHKRNPDLIELARAHSRQLVAERAALLDLLRDLPSGYHRDFQLIKPVVFRAHDRALALLAPLAALVRALEPDGEGLRAAALDPKLQATARALEKARQGVPFRDAYREESRGG